MHIYWEGVRDNAAILAAPAPGAWYRVSAKITGQEAGYWRLVHAYETTSSSADVGYFQKPLVIDLSKHGMTEWTKEQLDALPWKE